MKDNKKDKPKRLVVCELEELPLPPIAASETIIPLCGGKPICASWRWTISPVYSIADMRASRRN